MKIQFIGATHEVTGSCTFLSVGGRNYLVDCGMEQGKDVFENVKIPVPASDIDAVFITHAHIDHSGMLPKLYKDGFFGSVYATSVTCDLCNIMLKDSAHIQEMEAEWRSRKAERAGIGLIEPIYNMADALGVISKFRRCDYNKVIQISQGVKVRFTDIGHLLGSACIEMWLTENDVEKKIVFSGDVGNKNQRIVCDPKFIEQADYLVIESTYGNRVHSANKNDVVGELAKYIQRALDRQGNLIIPSFAVGRTQEMLFAIREIKQKCLIKGHDNFPVYVDSPLASDATSIFMQCDTICFDEETKELIKNGINPIWFDGIKITETSDESRQINFDLTPKVIISASGMCEAGRIRHHLKHNLWQEKNIILFVGYQAEGSLGRRLLDGVKRVTLFGEEVAVNAEICSLQGNSGHADKNGLMEWANGFKEKPKLVFVNHGDDFSCEDFKENLVKNGFNAVAPFSGAEYDLITSRMTKFAEGIPVSKKEKFNPKSRADVIYKIMVDEAETLLELVKQRRSKTNKDNGRITSQIREIIEKWKE